jgi:hypothetical protein
MEGPLVPLTPHPPGIGESGFSKAGALPPLPEPHFKNGVPEQELDRNFSLTTRSHVQKSVYAIHSCRRQAAGGWAGVLRKIACTRPRPRAMVVLPIVPAIASSIGAMVVELSRVE